MSLSAVWIGCESPDIARSSEISDSRDYAAPDAELNAAPDAAPDAELNVAPDAELNVELNAAPDAALDDLINAPPLMFTSCDRVDLTDRVLVAPSELNTPITDQVTLDVCTHPRWSFGLPSGARWSASIDLELNARVGPLSDQATSDQVEASRLEEALSELSAELSSRAAGSIIASEAQLISPLADSGAREEARVSAPFMVTRRRLAERALTLQLSAELQWVTSVNGDHQLTLNAADLERPLRSVTASELSTVIDVEVSAAIRLTCLSGCSARATRYPIVLIHGYAGVDQYFGLLDYFYRVPDTLRARGYEVIVPSLSPIEWSEERALQLSAALDEAQARTGARRFNLIAHSQGGLDARILISGEGLAEHERIASLTTVATPHGGIPIRVTDFLSVQDFSPEYMDTFNLDYPDHEATRYFSWSARTCTLVELRCLRDHANEVVTPFLLPTYTLLSRFGPSDGLVPTANMIYGEHLGELSADHFDQIGQVADQGGGAFAHRAFYLDEAARLRSLGL